MSDIDTLVTRLAALPKMQDTPRPELEWLATHGELHSFAAGTVVAPKGVPAVNLYVVLTGQITSTVDHGAGPRWAADFFPGDITGKLPYSRLVGPPGDAYVPVDTELLAVHERAFPDLVHRCPVFAARTVHHMIERARRYRTIDLQEEKMASLGRLAAGLAHEINNPASATVRGAKLLRELLAEVDAASRALGAASPADAVQAAIEEARLACMAHVEDTVRSPVEQADREDAIADWLAAHHADPAHATSLAETNVTLDALDALARATPGATLDVALRWIAVGCTAQALARDIESAATRIHELVSAIKRFTYMDAADGSGPVDVTVGLRDTVRVLAAKARQRGAGVTLDIAPGLPHAHAIGSELNQVWLNLLDNALDAVAASGRVTVTVHLEHARIIVRVIDDGAGIPPDILPRIFDPFFTTKPPGQGTGLGLEITRRLVRQSNGDITVQSHPGHTEFRVSLATEPSAS